MAEHAVHNHGALTRIQRLKDRLSRLSAGGQDPSPLRRDSIELQLRAAEERLLRLRLTAESNQQLLQRELKALHEDIEAESRQREASVLQRRRAILEAGQPFETNLNKNKQDKVALLESLHALIQRRAELLVEQLRNSGENELYKSRTEQLHCRVDSLTRSAADAMEAREAAFQAVVKKCEVRVSKLRAALSQEVSKRRSLASSLREMVETAFYQMQAVIQAEHSAREDVQRQLMDMLEEAVTRLENTASSRSMHHPSLQTSPSNSATKFSGDKYAREITPDRALTPSCSPPLSRCRKLSTTADAERTNISFGETSVDDEMDMNASLDVSLAQLPDAENLEIAESDAGSFAMWGRRSRSTDNLRIDDTAAAVERRATSSPRYQSSVSPTGIDLSETASPRFCCDHADSADFSSTLFRKMDAGRDCYAAEAAGRSMSNMSDLDRTSHYDEQTMTTVEGSDWESSAYARRDGRVASELKATTGLVKEGYRGSQGHSPPPSELTLKYGGYSCHSADNKDKHCYGHASYASTSVIVDNDALMSHSGWRKDRTLFDGNGNSDYFTSSVGKRSANSLASFSSTDEGGCLLWAAHTSAEGSEVLPSGNDPDSGSSRQQDPPSSFGTATHGFSESPRLRPYQPISRPD